MLAIIIAVKWKTICHGTQDVTLAGIIKIMFKINFENSLSFHYTDLQTNPNPAYETVNFN